MHQFAAWCLTATLNFQQCLFRLQCWLPTHRQQTADPERPKAILKTATKIHNSARLVLRFAGTGSCSSVVLQVATSRLRAHWPRVLRCYCMAQIGGLSNLALGLRTVPYLDLGISTQPDIDLWLRTLPNLDLRLSTPPDLDLGLRALPSLDLGQSTLPNIDLGLSTLPNLGLGLRTPPDFDLGLSSLPIPDLGQSTLPNVDLGLSTYQILF